MRHVLAFDFGGSSGRAVLAHFDGTKIELEEIHRFENSPVMIGGRLYWDVLRLFHELKTGLVRAKHICKVECIGIDTWGVDFGLLDSSGSLMSNPYHYRDTKNNGYAKKAESVMSASDLYMETGTQIMDINTLFQLLSLYDIQPELLRNADILLPMPDLFAYFLTGIKTCERSMASTASMMNISTGQWSESVADRFGINRSLLPELTDCCTIKGELSPEICSELETEPIPMVDSYFFQVRGEIFPMTMKNVLRRIDQKRRKEYRAFTRSAEIISSNESSVLKVWEEFFLK